MRSNKQSAAAALKRLHFARIEESNRLFAAGYRELAALAAAEAGRLAIAAENMKGR